VKLRLPRWLAMLPLSLALHALAVAGVVAWLRPDARPPLVIDLRAVAVGREDVPAAADARAEHAAASPSPRVGGKASSSSPPTPSPPRAIPSPPAVPPPPAASSTPAPEREPVPARATDPQPAPDGTAPERTTEPRATSSPPTPTGPSASGADAAPARGGQPRGDAAASGASESPAAAAGTGGVGSGGRGGDRVAAVPRGTGDGTGARDGTGLGTEYDAYYARIRQRIQQTARYPSAARGRGLVGTVELEIDIAADGAVANVAVVRSSSHEVLDRAAVQAARAVPRTPFPPGVRPRPLTVVIPVSFELQ
jgi:protein TonB